MANQEHLDILKQGVQAWNQWRNEHPDLQPVLQKAAFIQPALGEVKFIQADLSEANLSGANLMGADLRHVNFRGANLSEANLYGACLIGVNLIGARLLRATLRKAELGGVNLYRASLREASLKAASLSIANLYGADLREADLRETNLFETNLSAANLRDADLSGATLRQTFFGDVDLSTVNGLETVKHLGPSTIGIDTIIRSQGKIPEIFLRGAGVPPSIMEAIPSLIGSLKPIDFFSCFISYSSKDQDFAERLYADLRAKGVRCWLDKEDLKIGEKFRPRIDEAIRRHDKLLLVLSQHSVRSVWVEKEVETAFEKERRYKKLVLFPIRLVK
jgi:TIR domain-containing protein/pentapeptide repeat protein